MHAFVWWFAVKWTNRPGELDSWDGQDTVGFFAWVPKRTGKQGDIVPPPLVPDARPPLDTSPPNPTGMIAYRWS